MRGASAPVPDHGWAGRASWPSPICGRPHPSAARTRLISFAPTPAEAAASCTLTRPSRISMQSASSAPLACPASPPPRLLRPSCPPRLGPPLSSGPYSPSVAPQRAGLLAGATGWYGNRHVSSCGVPHGEAYSDHQHAYKMYFRVMLKGCRRSHNALFRRVLFFLLGQTWGRRSVHKLAKMTFRRRFGSFVYTIALRAAAECAFP